MSAEKHQVKVASYVIFEREGKILVARRFNTGYMDGKYQMPSGHIESQEYPAEAAIREAKEEVGVDIRLEDLEFVHVAYRVKNLAVQSSDYAAFFFRARKWEGEPTNKEPEKCDDLAWFTYDALPENVAPPIKHVLESLARGELYSEYGRS